MQRLVSDPYLRARMGRAARVHAEELFSVPAYTARLGRLLRDAAPVLMANAPASRSPRVDRDTSRPVALNPWPTLPEAQEIISSTQSPSRDTR